jgi:DNA polymerase-3 subunit gamma/tau
MNLDLNHPKVQNGFNPEVYIEEKRDKGDFIEVLPKNQLSFERLTEHKDRIEAIYGKPVKILSVKEEIRDFKISDESKRKIEKVISTFNGKLLPGFPKPLNKKAG